MLTKTVLILWKLNWELLAKKNKYNYGNNISRIYSETLRVMHEPITRNINKQLDIFLGEFAQEELNSVLRKINNRKAVGLDEISPRSMEDQATQRHTAPTL